MKRLIQIAQSFAFLSLCAAISCIAMPQASVPASTAPAEQIDGIFAGISSTRTPGAAVLVLQNGQVKFERGYGVADLHSFPKIDAHTNFRLASCTKQFTAMAIMLLVHDGKLRYQDRLTDVFPDFPDYGKAITIRNLLNHTSGLLDYEDLMEKPAAGTPPERIPQIKDAGVLAILKRQRTTNFPPGTKWDYSNSGYAVLAMVVQKVSGKPFGDFLHDRIGEPIDVAARLVTDLAKWDQALTNHALLSEAEMKPAITPVKVSGHSVQEPDGTPAAYGFGWFLNSYKGHARMWHYGETVGFRTTIQRFVDDKLTIIILCNRDDQVPANLALKIADLFLAAPH